MIAGNANVYRVPHGAAPQSASAVSRKSWTWRSTMPAISMCFEFPGSLLRVTPAGGFEQDLCARYAGGTRSVVASGFSFPTSVADRSRRRTLCFEPRHCGRDWTGHPHPALNLRIGRTVRYVTPPKPIRPFPKLLFAQPLGSHTQTSGESLAGRGFGCVNGDGGQMRMHLLVALVLVLLIPSAVEMGASWVQEVRGRGSRLPGFGKTSIGPAVIFGSRLKSG